MTGSRWGEVAIGLAITVIAVGAGPSTPSFYAIERTIAQIEEEWKALTPEQNPHGPAWLIYFGELRSELREYTRAKDADERVAALNKLYKRAQGLDQARWSAAHKLRDELRHWLAPRVALAWAEYRLIEALPTDNAELRDKWIAFLNKSLRPAVGDVESAGTVAAQWAAFEKLHNSIDALQRSRDQQDWSKSRALYEALGDLYCVRNVELSVDATGVSNFIMPQGLVEPGPIFFRNQWSYVTAGPVLGIGFIPTSDGIQVSVSQALTSITPVRGFQDEIAADPRGQRAARMYQFSATTRNDAVLTMVALFRVANGLYLAPSYNHGVSAAISSAPQSGGGFLRLVAALMGQSQRKITDKVYENAIGPMRENVADGSRELSSIRTSESAARLNAQIRPFVLDDHTMGTGDFRLTNLSLQTLATHAVARGTLGSGSTHPRGALVNQPSHLLSPAAGVTADVHLPSALTDLVAGQFERDEVANVANVVIAPGNEDESGPQVTTNVDFATFVEQMKSLRASGRAARGLRIKRPEKAPFFSTDRSGNLVVAIKDLHIELPAPEQAARGGLTGPPAVVYRIVSPLAELSLAIDYTQAEIDSPARLAVRIVGFDGGPNAQVLAVVDENAQPQPLNAVQARIVLAALAASASGQSIPVPLEQLPLSSFVVNSVSPLDPSGWIRVVLMPARN